jgi:hypothetical protein
MPTTTLILVTILNVSPLPVLQQYNTYEACEHVLKATLEASIAVYKGNSTTTANLSANEGWSKLTTPIGRVLLKAKCV